MIKNFWKLSVIWTASAVGLLLVQWGFAQTAAGPATIAPPETAAKAASDAKPKGERVYYASHSLMWDVPPLLSDAATAYGISNHTLVGMQRLGFSRTIQHWDQGGGQNQARQVLTNGGVDVFVMSPIDLPDPGIDNFVKLGLEHNPKMRFLLQVNWGGFDQDGQLARQIMGGGGRRGSRAGGTERGPSPNALGGPAAQQDPVEGGGRRAQEAQPEGRAGRGGGAPGGRRGFGGAGGFGGPQVDWNSKTVEDLKTLNKDNVKGFEDQADAINKEAGRTVVYLIPISQAASALRTRIIEGKFPGLQQQSQLFSDFIGHPTAVLTTLNMYCHFAVLYGQSPVGLPMPATLKRANNPAWDEDFNKRLQELAWETVVKYPYSGVKTPGGK